jgi:hypothetical protein
MPDVSGLPVYFGNATGRIYEHPDGYAILYYQTGLPQETEHDAFLTHLTNLLQRRGWHKLLTNKNAASAFTETEQGWMRQHWGGMAQVLQRRVVAAVVLPDEVFARLAVSTFLQSVPTQNLSYQVFSNAHEAAAWLRQAK